MGRGDVLDPDAERLERGHLFMADHEDVHAGTLPGSEIAAERRGQVPRSAFERVQKYIRNHAADGAVCE
jgi:hypothetical protein